MCPAHALASMYVSTEAEKIMKQSRYFAFPTSKLVSLELKPLQFAQGSELLGKTARARL